MFPLIINNIDSKSHSDLSKFSSEYVYYDQYLKSLVNPKYSGDIRIDKKFIEEEDVDSQPNANRDIDSTSNYSDVESGSSNVQSWSTSVSDVLSYLVHKSSSNSAVSDPSDDYDIEAQLEVSSATISSVNSKASQSNDSITNAQYVKEQVYSIASSIVSLIPFYPKCSSYQSSSNISTCDSINDVTDVKYHSSNNTSNKLENVV